MAASSSSSFTEAADDDAGKAPPPSSSQQQQQQTAAASSFLSRSEDLVARAIAPVKPQYLLPPPTRPRNNNNNNNNNNKPSPAQDVAGDQHNNQGASDKKGGQAGGGIAVVVKEKKSKRQLKRERQQEKKSVKNLCPEVAKIGDAAACKYGSGCRFSHDLDGFLRQGQASEWALVRRHSSEDLFGVQICGAYPDTVSRTVELIGHECSVDFIDINMGCPIDIVVNRGAGSALLTKPMRMKNIIQVAAAITDKPLTIKVRTGFLEGRNRIDSLLCDISNWGASMVTIHGRSRQQRYSKVADWDYIYKCARQAPDSLQILGNGDIFSYLDWNKHLPDCPQLSSCMIARGALIKPWIFTEIKEQRHWDITSGERLEIFKKYVNFGLEHWGSDGKDISGVSS